MIVNEKKPLRLQNNTKYFLPGVSRTHNEFSSPSSYQSRRIKIEGYESRLYWQFRYCDENNGQTYFYTLTYNEKSKPTIYGEPCFDYEDLRDLLTGGFRKQLLRKFGTKFKYFIGAELGDGKGERGMHNNPHYHILFFLEDAKNERFPYVKILPEQFRHLVRMYWQGFDEDTDGYHDYRDAKYGIAREGENIGLVTDFRACMYCAKYVCKDVKLKRNERRIASAYSRDLDKKYFESEEFHRRFFDEVIVPMYNIPQNAKKTEWFYTDEQLVYTLMPDYDRTCGLPFVDDDCDIEYRDVIDELLKKDTSLWNQFAEFKKQVAEEGLRKALNEYRNRYCNKCRISQGVGDYALEFVDLENPCIPVPDKKGFKNRPLSMYYYRKLFTEVVKDEKGSNIRILNLLGQDYKVSHLEEHIQKKVDTASRHLDILRSSRDLYKKMQESDVNTEVFESYDEFFEKLDYLLKENNITNILRRYGEYKCIYEDRFYRLGVDKESGEVFHPCISPIDDYRHFIVPTIFATHRSDLRLACFLESHSEDWIGYFAHPYFLRYQCVFRVLDLCADYFFVQKDNRQQKEAEERAAVKRFHDKEKVKEFYRFYK